MARARARAIGLELGMSRFCSAWVCGEGVRDRVGVRVGVGVAG